MSDQASELRSRWLALAPFIRREILTTGRAGEPEAQWIAVNFARLQLRRLRVQMRIVLSVFVVTLGVILGILKALDVLGTPLLVGIGTVLTVPFVLAVFAWGRGRVIVFNRILTLNESVLNDTSAQSRYGYGTALPGTTAGTSVLPVSTAGTSVPGAPSAGTGRPERLEVRLALGRITVRFGGIALILAIIAAALAAFGKSTGVMVVCAGGSVGILAVLAWTLIRAHRNSPMVELSEDGVRVSGWNRTVPWNRVTGVRVITVNERRGGSHVLALLLDDPQGLIADLSGTYARAAQRSLSAYGTPLTFGDHYTDTTAHTIANTASAWTGLPIRSS